MHGLHPVIYYIPVMRTLVISSRLFSSRHSRRINIDIKVVRESILYIWEKFGSINVTMNEPKAFRSKETVGIGGSHETNSVLVIGNTVSFNQDEFDSFIVSSI